MTTPRVFHAATFMPPGRILVTGGVVAPPSDPLERVEASDQDAALGSAELFDTTACAFLPQGLTLPEGRAHHSAELLPSNDLVLLIGGEPYESMSSARYYHIADKVFADKIDLAAPSTRHASTVVSLSKPGILITGGHGNPFQELLPRIQFFERGQFNSLSESLGPPGSVAVNHSKGVLITGGWQDNQTATADIVNVIFDDDGPKIADPVQMNHPRAHHTAVLVGDPGSGEKVFVCGGLRAKTEIEDTCEIIDLNDLSSIAAAGAPVSRWMHTATSLPGGRVLIAGGYTVSGPTKVALVFNNPIETPERTTSNMVGARAGHTATLLPNGMVVLIGGVGRNDYEIYNP